MSPEKILHDAAEMAAHYPGDRLRLTGLEVLELAEHVRRMERDRCAHDVRTVLPEGAVWGRAAEVAEAAIRGRRR